jgi:hypothetical protein
MTPVYGWMLPVLHLDPVFRPAGAVGAFAAFRQHALESQVEGGERVGGSWRARAVRFGRRRASDLAHASVWRALLMTAVMLLPPSSAIEGFWRGPALAICLLQILPNVA